jgi:hypothetical protein
MKWIVGIVVSLAMCFGLYKIKYPTYTYRYRMTVEIEAGGQIRSGSSVIEVTVTRVPQILPEAGPYERSAEGQAVFVDLPDGKNIVALLTSGQFGERGDYVLDVVPRVFKVARVQDLPNLTGNRELPPDQMPTLITVINPNDAGTAQVVKPAALEDLLGVHLRAISIEMTTDSVTTRDIPSHLPFLVQGRQRQRRELRYLNVFTPYYSAFVRE